MTPSSSLLVVPVSGLAFGILASRYGASIFWSAFLISAAAILYYILCRLSKDPVRSYRLNKLHYIWMFLIFMAVGILNFTFTRPRLAPELLNGSIYAEGIIEQFETKSNGDRSLVKVNHLIGSTYKRRPCPTFLVIVQSDVLSSSVGDIIRFPFTGQRIEDNPNSFFTGYAESMEIKGILFKEYVTDKQITKISHIESLNCIANRTRSYLEQIIETSGLSTPTSHFLITILLGDRQYLDSRQQILFADAGLSHILALSGMHVGIICWLLLWLLMPINLLGKYKLRLILTILILFFYAFITGWSPSTVRSVLMMTALVISIFCERKNNVWNALLFATLIILLFTPEALFDAGFQLSFSCVMSLIFLGNTINPINRRSYPVTYKIFAAIIASLAATFGTWCLGAYYFKQIPILFLPVNIPVLFLLPLYILMAIVYIVLSACGLHIDLLGLIVDAGYDGLISFLDWITGDASSAVNFNPDIFTVLLWFVAISCLFFIVNGKKNKYLIFATCGLFLCFFTLIIFNKGAKEGIIVKSGSTSISLNYLKNGLENDIKISRNKVSEFNLKNDKFLFIDGKVNMDKLFEHPKHYRAVIIGSGAKLNLPGDLERLNTDLVITHPSLRKKKEVRILSNLDSLGIETFSIRKKGPWKLIYED